MANVYSRRGFVRAGAGAAALASAGGWELLDRLPRVSAAQAAPDPDKVRFAPDIEPLVQFLEETHHRGSVIIPRLDCAGFFGVSGKLRLRRLIQDQKGGNRPLPVDEQSM